MTNDFRRYCDVFYGNGRCNLPQPEGVAATWFFIKARCGNTHPHAVLPFGKMSCGLYTGGYPMGRGNHAPNSCGPVTTFPAKVRGFAHMHQSGTGGTGTYYNYAPAAPMYGELRELEEEIAEETGEPGYYAATLSESGIRGEFTVENHVALHRYTLSGAATLSVDFSNDGLSRTFSDRFYQKAQNAEIRIEDGSAMAAVTLHGIRTYFYVLCEGNVQKTYLWKDYKEATGDTLCEGDTPARFGAAFAVHGDCILKVAVSHKSAADARRMAESAADFDTVRARAATLWEAYLGKIEIEADERTKRLFYSNLYHSIVKPSRLEDGMFTDFSTLWDMYKTQLPLVYTLYQKESRAIADTLYRAGKTYGKVPIGIMLTEEIRRFDGQAKMLSVITLADAYYRGHAEAAKVLETARGEMADICADIAEMIKEERYTHILDVAEAASSAARIAAEAGEDADVFSCIADRWTEAFDEKTGLLKEGRAYYEGDHWNYSFRLLADMEKRIGMCGTKADFVALADSFFGFGKEAVVQSPYPDDEKYIDDLALHRFDGANNEHDMESPYVYLFAGRHDKTCEVLDGIRKYMFTEGRGGLPGNNDTGALSSLYVWNTLGIFPVAGQDKMLVGLPGIRQARLHLPGGRVFEILVEGEGNQVEKAVLSGRELPDMQFTVREMMAGGTLYIKLK